LPPKTKKRRGPRPGMLHLDARAAQLAAAAADGDALMSTKELAQFLGVSEQWVATARHKGTGPPYEYLGPRMIRYRPINVKRWLDLRTRQRTAEYAK